MAKIKDLRPITPRTNGTRPLSDIKNIARHYSATKTGDWYSFWRYWNGTLGWGTGGYHEIILPDGTVELCYDPHEITNGVGGQNSYIYNICLVSDGTFTDAQEKAWEERARYWMQRLNLPVSAIKGHSEFPGQSTSCPGINMNTVRSRLSGQASISSGNNFSKNYIKQVQGLLNQVGFALGVDGVLGKSTLNAIQMFQRRAGLVVDGSAGPLTMAALKEVIAKNKQPKKEEPKLPEYKKDAQPSKSIAPEFEKAVEAGITDGTYPQRPATREEVAVMVLRGLNLKN